MKDLTDCCATRRVPRASRPLGAETAERVVALTLSGNRSGEIDPLDRRP